MVRGYTITAMSQKAKEILSKLNKKDKNANITYNKGEYLDSLTVELKSHVLWMMKKAGGEIKPEYIKDTLKANGFKDLTEGVDYEVQFLD